MLIMQIRKCSTIITEVVLLPMVGWFHVVGLAKEASGYASPILLF